ncbi:MAG: hypothetical protein PHF86_13485 [Candidatus Nanoarchaeia archaeon]|nr:hypothetical protein [Candidatus Nanoarchaeia archaeon]
MINEKYYSTMEVITGAMEVFLNPTIDEIKEISLAGEDTDNEFSYNNPPSRTLRAFILEDGNVIAWNEYKSDHREMIKKLDLVNKKVIPIYIYMNKNMKSAENVEISVWSGALLGYNVDDPDVMNQLERKKESNPYLVSILQGKDYYGESYHKYIDCYMFKG